MLKTLLLNPLYNVLLLIYALLPGHDFGIAIIIFTVFIRMLLWPLIRKQLTHQKAMRDLQPEIAKLKKQAKGDRQKESQLMLELFKEKGVNPFGAIGLTLLQFPILIALFFVLNHVADPGKVGEVAYSFVAQLGPVKEIIANPGSFTPTLLGLVHLSKPSLVLAVLAGVAQYFQARQITPRDTDNPANKLGNQMLLIFPIITIVFAAQLPSGVALYWVASSLIAVYQQHLVLAEDVTFMRRLLRRGGGASGSGR